MQGTPHICCLLELARVPFPGAKSSLPWREIAFPGRELRGFPGDIFHYVENVTNLPWKIASGKRARDS